MHRTDFSDAYKGLKDGLDTQDALAGNRSDPASNTSLHLASSNGGGVDLGLETFINYRGVAVLFAPGIRALATLATD